MDGILLSGLIEELNFRDFVIFLNIVKLNPTLEITLYVGR